DVRELAVESYAQQPRLRVSDVEGGTMFVARMRTIGLIFAIGVALASAVCALPAIGGPTESGRSYEFPFERGADRLKFDSRTSDQIVSVRDLFDHQGWRPELKFRIEAPF